MLPGSGIDYAQSGVCAAGTTCTYRVSRFNYVHIHASKVGAVGPSSVTAAGIACQTYDATGEFGPTTTGLSCVGPGANMSVAYTW